MSTNFFSSLSGQFDLNASMSSLYGDYNTIKSGAYGSLMKAYVGKVGNKAALQNYKETGSATASAGTTSSAKGTNFLDNYFKEKTEAAKVSSTAKTSTTDKTQATDKTSDTTDAAATTVSAADKYEKYKSSWLDDQLGQYNKDAAKTTAADTSVGLDTTI